MDFDKLQQIEAIITDVDGVLTDGKLHVGAQQEVKIFSVRDGLGLKLAQRAGLKIGFLSGRFSAPVEARAKELGVDVCKVGRLDKQTALAEIEAEIGVAPARMAYIGDDIIDLAPLALAGVGFCPRDAVAEVKARVDHVVPIDGGSGVVRYVIEHVLKAKGVWHELVASFEVKHG